MSGLAMAAEPLDLRRRWIVITIATVVMQFAYWPTVAARAVATVEEAEVTGGLLALGLAIVPAAFLVLAFGSRHPNAATATLKAMGLFLLVGLPLIVIVNVVAGMVAGLAAGGLAALRRDEVHSLRARWWAVLGAVVYVFALLAFAPGFAAMTGAVLPFALHGIVDQAVETR